MPARSTKNATEPPQAARSRSATRATGSGTKKKAAASPKKRAAKKTSTTTKKTTTVRKRKAPAVVEETVVAAVRRDLDALAQRGDEGRALAIGAHAMTALALAKSIDHERTSPTARSMCSRALTETMQKLRELAPDEDEEGDGIDDLAERRQKRRARSAAA